ncbi:MAG: PH domain-containing protein [Pirellulaceae bacterium]|nr:PH domain-containing protein [Pirellulaceae bacterium]
MPSTTFVIQRDRLYRYYEVISLIGGLYFIGWLLLKIGFAKAYRSWVDSFVYRLDHDCLAISSCYELWGFVLFRQEKRIPLEKITDLRLMQGPVLSKMGLWCLYVQTASSGSQGPEAILHALDNPREARDQIMQAVTERGRSLRC